MKKILVEYSSNNSGGSWWLDDKDWKALEKAGWKVKWFSEEKDNGFFTINKDGRWLGGLASHAEKEFDSITKALEEFEIITGQEVSSEGCNCCGEPHSFSWKEGKENNYCSGEECLKYLFPDKEIPSSVRETLEK